jgi:hypothetical protein
MTSFFGPRAAAVSAVAFAVLLLFGVASINVPHAASDQEMLDWWSKDGNQTSAIASMYFVALSAIALVLFLSHARERLNGDGGHAGNPVFAVGLGAAAMFLATAAVRGTIAMAVKVSDEPLPGVDTLRYFPLLSYALIDVALVCMGACLLLVAWAVRQTKAFPAWFGWVSLATGLLALGLSPFLQGFTLPVTWIWALAAAAATWRSEASGAAARVGKPSLQP